MKQVNKRRAQSEEPLQRIVKEDLREEVTQELKDENAPAMLKKLWKGGPGRGNMKGKCLRAGRDLEYLKDSKEGYCGLRHSNGEGKC